MKALILSLCLFSSLAHAAKVTPDQRLDYYELLLNKIGISYKSLELLPKDRSANFGFLGITNIVIGSPYTLERLRIELDNRFMTCTVGVALPDKDHRGIAIDDCDNSPLTEAIKIKVDENGDIPRIKELRKAKAAEGIEY